MLSWKLTAMCHGNDGIARETQVKDSSLCWTLHDRQWFCISLLCIPDLREAYRDRRLTTNFELWVEIFCVPTCFHMRIQKPCLSVCPSVCPHPEKRNHLSFRQYQSYMSNWYINGKVFTSTTPWKPKNMNSFSKSSKLTKLCPYPVFPYAEKKKCMPKALASSISVLHK